MPSNLVSMNFKDNYYAVHVIKKFVLTKAIEFNFTGVVGIVHIKKNLH